MRLKLLRQASWNTGRRNQADAASSSVGRFGSWFMTYRISSTGTQTAVQSASPSAIFARRGVSTRAVISKRRFPLSSVTSRVSGFPWKGCRTECPKGGMRDSVVSSPPVVAFGKRNAFPSGGASRFPPMFPGTYPADSHRYSVVPATISIGAEAVPRCSLASSGACSYFRWMAQRRQPSRRPPAIRFA